MAEHNQEQSDMDHGLDLGREAIPTGGFYQPTEEELKQRKKRNRAIAAMVVVFMVLVYGITMTRLQQNAKANLAQELAPPPLLTDPAQN
ncbi:MAG: hypothetical protein V3V30_00440 [Parvularculaceae bacterium]